MTVKPTEVQILSPAKFQMQIDLPNNVVYRFNGEFPSDAHAAGKYFKSVAEQIEGQMIDGGWFLGGIRSDLQES